METPTQTTAAPKVGRKREGRRRGSAGRWLVAVGVGAVSAVPLGLLLSYAATLPFFFGLFFFALFGLIVGAITHRVAAPARPYDKATLILGTTGLVLLAWTISLAKVARDFPADMSEMASQRTLDLGDRDRRAYLVDVEAQVVQYLREHHPPGGSLGYVRWVLSDGVLPRGSIAGVQTALEVHHRRVTWAVRVMLSLGLLAFGVGSQTLSLRLDEDPLVRAIDRRDRATAEEEA